MPIVADALGWVGAVALLVAYAMLCFRRLSVESASLQGLNVAGSLLLIINTVYYGAYPSAAVNVIWTVIPILSRMHANRKTAL